MKEQDESAEKSPSRLEKAVSDLKRCSDFSDSLRSAKPAATHESMDRFLAVSAEMDNFLAYIGMLGADENSTRNYMDRHIIERAKSNSAVLEGLHSGMENFVRSYMAAFEARFYLLTDEIARMSKKDLVSDKNICSALDADRHEAASLSHDYGIICKKAQQVRQELAKIANQEMISYEGFVSRLNAIDAKFDGFIRRYNSRNFSEKELVLLADDFRKDVLDAYAAEESRTKPKSCMGLLYNRLRGRKRIFTCADKVKRAQEFSDSLSYHMDNFGRVQEKSAKLDEDIAFVSEKIKAVSSMKEYNRDDITLLNSILASVKPDKYRSLKGLGFAGEKAGFYHGEAEKLRKAASESLEFAKEYELEEMRKAMESIQRDCRKLSNALEVGDYNEAYVDIAKYDSFREKPFAAMLNEQIEEYKSLSEKMARMVRKEKTKLQPIVVQKKVVYGIGGNGARAEVPSYYTPTLAVDDVVRSSSVKPNKGSLINDFEQLRKIKPRTSMYSEVSDVLLGESTTIMPKRGEWHERMSTIANAVNGYQPLETEEDRAYFRDVAASLVNSMENGLLRNLSGISRKNEEAAKNAIDSVMYLLERSEKAQAA